jgi:hypothetical protein
MFVPKYPNCCTLSKELSSVFISRLRPAFWSRDMTMYLVLSAFTSRPFSLLATTSASVFYFIVCMLLPNILTSLAWSPIIWTRKLTYLFLIFVQLEAHSHSWRLTRKLRTTIYPSDFYHCILSIFYYTKVVFSPLPILNFLHLRR